MSGLPEKRVTGDIPPFSNSGVNYFGPFYAKQGRKQLKRYGVIFSCMSSRAIHIEVSHSLDTDSFINSLWRFVSRRGNVRSLTSDNGTNMVGSDRELRRAIDSWNNSKIGNYLKQNYIEWNFNTPLSSHFGGFFEREIRSIRQVFTSMMNQQNIILTDEELLTLSLIHI